MTCSAIRHKQGTLSAIVAAVILISACSSQNETRKTETVYRPVFTEPEAAASQSRGTIGGDYAWAASAPTFQDAAQRWQEFLARHDPPDGEFEDGYHQQHVETARQELLRVYYVLGRIEEGDALLRKFGPLK